MKTATVGGAFLLWYPRPADSSRDEHRAAQAHDQMGWLRKGLLQRSEHGVLSIT